MGVIVKEVTGNLWQYYNRPGFVICITTNATIKKNGEVVMGRGCAAECKHILPDFPKKLGQAIKEHGNVVLQPYNYGDHFPECRVLSFPVKHNYWEDADLKLIKRSARRLKELSKESEFIYILPRPGCGNGNLKWEDVKKVLQKVKMPNEIWVISK